MRMPPDYERQILDLARERGVEPVPIRAGRPESGKCHVVIIPGWRPALDNELLRGSWQARGRLKRRDAEVVASACVLAIPRAVGRRRVRVRISNRYVSRVPDPLAPFKSLLDALVQCGMLIDDSERWCEVVTPAQYQRGPLVTTIELTDLE